MYEYTIQNSQPLTKSIRENLPFLNEIQIKKLFENKDIKVNNVRVRGNQDLNVGDNVKIFLNVEKYLENIITVVYQDNNIIILNKPQGIESVSDDTNKYTLLSFLKTKYNKVFPLHRLDLNTKGLIIYALNETSLNELTNAIKYHEISKVYYAIVYSKSIIKQCKYEDYAIINKTTNTTKITDKQQEKTAILEIIDTKKLNNDLSLIKINLTTGRMHQIRAQLAYHKIYVLGDKKYGDKEINKKYKKDKQLLQASELHFNLKNQSTLAYLNEIHITLPFKYNI